MHPLPRPNLILTKLIFAPTPPELEPSATYEGRGTELAALLSLDTDLKTVPVRVQVRGLFRLRSGGAGAGEDARQQQTTDHQRPKNGRAAIPSADSIGNPARYYCRHYKFVYFPGRCKRDRLIKNRGKKKWEKNTADGLTAS